jgi:hypothetical protein
MFGFIWFRVIKTYLRLKYFTCIVFVYGLFAELWSQYNLSTVPVQSDTLETLLIESYLHQITVVEAMASTSYMSAGDIISERGSSTSYSDIVSEIPGLIAQDRYILAHRGRTMM